MVELLKQPEQRPYEVTDQVLSIYAATKGFLDDVEIGDIAEFEKGLLNYFAGSGRAVRDELERSKALSDDLNAKIEETIRGFKSTWHASRSERQGA
jgi:F-type H+-transporting ATPase subunit alpha